MDLFQKILKICSLTFLLEISSISNIYCEGMDAEDFDSEEAELNEESEQNEEVGLSEEAVSQFPNIKTEEESLNKTPGVKTIMHPASAFVIAIFIKLYDSIKKSAVTQKEKTASSIIQREIDQIKIKYIFPSESQKNRIDIIRKSKLLTLSDLSQLVDNMRVLAGGHARINEAEACDIKNTLIGCGIVLQSAQNIRLNRANFSGLVVNRFEKLTRNFIRHKVIEYAEYKNVNIKNLKNYRSDPHMHYGFLLDLYEHNPRDIISNYALLVELIKIKNEELIQYKPKTLDEQCMKAVSLLFMHQLLVHIIACADVDEMFVQFYISLKGRDLPAINLSQWKNDSFLHRFRAALIQSSGYIGNKEFIKLIKRIEKIESNVKDEYSRAGITDKKVLSLARKLKDSSFINILNKSRCWEDSYKIFRQFVAKEKMKT